MAPPRLVGDADDLPDRLRVIERAQHELRDVGARDDDSSPQVLPQCRPVAAGQWTVGEPRGRTMVQSRLLSCNTLAGWRRWAMRRGLPRNTWGIADRNRGPRRPVRC